MSFFSKNCVRHVSSAANKLNLTRRMKDVVLIDGVRTPFLVAGTDYKNMIAHDLAHSSLVALKEKIPFPLEEIDHAVYGCVMMEFITSNIAREAMLSAGYPEKISAHTITQACISSNQCSATAISMIASDQADTVVVGGVDFMSDVPIRFNRKMRQLMLSLNKAKSGNAKFSVISKMLSPKVWSPELPGIADFTSGEIMGHYADRLCAAFNVSQAEQDEFANRSHTKAFEATKNGHLTDVFPMYVEGGKDAISTDNGIRITPIEKLNKIRPAFIKPHGTVTAGNSSFLTDGASAALIMSEEKAKQLNVKCKAYLRDYMFYSCNPNDELLLGPAVVIPRLLKKIGATLSDIDVFEIHEAFAGQILANLKAMSSDKFAQRRLGTSKNVGEVPMEKLNTWGGSLALGHPFAATGTRLITMAANRLHQEDKKYALVAACAAGGQAVAMLIERHPDY
ncbi:hypothetical protein SNEBB_003196 [Seison nebaliae]|nr:hypothetical protein SNEBB_003196 [Seison nebaliae]